MRRGRHRRPAEDHVDSSADGAHPHTMTTASASASHQDAPDFARFAIGFDQRDRARLHALIDEVLDSNRWSEADLNARFEAAWEVYNDAPAVAMSSWAGVDRVPSF